MSKKLFLIIMLVSSTLLIFSQHAIIRNDEPRKDINGNIVDAHDGRVICFGGMYYWYGTSYGTTNGFTNSNYFTCYSSPDLMHWKPCGHMLVDAPSGVYYRPHVVYNTKTKKYVMWFHLELKGQGYAAARTATAVSDSPTGPFTYIESFRPNAGKYPVNADGMPTDSLRDRFFLRDFKGGQMARDMQLFVDDDGKAYHIASSEENYTMMVSLLTDDYLRPSGTFARILVMHQYEGPALFKKDGKYYFFGSGCTGWAPNPGHSAVAEHIFGPWKEFGNFAIGEKSNTTFDSQSTYVLPVQGKKDAFIYLGDRWTPNNAIDGRYIWLPIEWEDGRPVIHWSNEWDLNVFNKK